MALTTCESIQNGQVFVGSTVALQHSKLLSLQCHPSLKEVSIEHI